MSWNRSSGGSGENGKSAYQIWLEQGNTGTEQDFLNSMSAINDSLTSTVKSWSSSKIKTYVDTKPTGGGGSGSTTTTPVPYYVPTEEDGATDPLNRVYRYWTVEEMYSAWDSLMTQYPKYISREIAPYKDMSNTWELRRYVLAPEYGYDKTMYIGAGVHGSEYANKLSILRIAQLLCERWHSHPSLEYLRNRVRLVIIPIINPYGHTNNTLVNSNDTANSIKGKGVNCNRNYDAFWLQTVNSAGAEHNGAYPFSENESKWVRETIDWIGVENIHYALDLHDAPSLLHGDYWINYNTFHKVSKRETKKLLRYLIQKNVVDAQGRSANIYHDKDTETSGVFPLWSGRTLGVPASTVECCYDMQPFTKEFMTLAVEVYINAIIVNALTDDHKHPVVISNNSWFDVEWYKAGVEYVWYSVNKSYDTISGFGDFRGANGKWDDLVTKYPNYVQKGNQALTNSEGKPVYYYIVSPKRYKKTILVVGGRMEANTEAHPFAISTLRLAELLCEFGEKDEHLSSIKKNVRYVFVPYLEYNTYYLNAYGNFAVDGTPNTTKIPVQNIISIIDSLGTIDGVIYAREKNKNDIYSATTDDEFAIPPQDTNDIVDVQRYINYLNEKKNLVALKTQMLSSGTGEFGNYVFNKRGIPCVRIDTGIDHKTYEKQKDQFDGSTGVEFTIVPVERYVVMDSEICHRINNIVNITKLMIKE